MDFINIDSFLLIVGLIFTFFIPGFVIVEFICKDLLPIFKLPLYFLVAILSSTYFIYLISLVIGFSKLSILISFFVFTLGLLLIIRKKATIFKQILPYGHFKALIFSVVIFVLFFISLYPAIFYPYKNYFVMSAVNWQDTAMHLSIIETISQGNFPPQAPYFSGSPLNYYFFVDFHSAILETLIGKFFPRVLIYDNPFFVFTFFLSVYALSFYLFKSKKAAIFAATLVCFSGNFLFTEFLKDITDNLGASNNILENIKSLITDKNYTMRYGQLMQMVPMADYFLQNRPMMVGLPAVSLVILLILLGINNGKRSYLLLSGLITGTLIKFQLFAFGVCNLIFILSWLIFLRKKGKTNMQGIISFFGPILSFLFINYLLFNQSNYIIETFISTFRLGPWDPTKGIFWYLSFPIVNFGLPFIITIAVILAMIFRKIYPTKKLVLLLFLAAILFLIPYSVSFTLYDGDMLKFFYFMLIPTSIIAGLFLQRISTNFFFSKILVILVIITASFTSILTLGWSFFNKYQGYSMQDYKVGVWIRENTPKNSIFMTAPTVHSAVSEIGGRLRVLSYITWPYSHGFNKGEDNVFSRQKDIETLYQTDSQADKILDKYKINYVYLGAEEKNKYPQAEVNLSKIKELALIYNREGIKIFQAL